MPKTWKQNEKNWGWGWGTQKFVEVSLEKSWQFLDEQRKNGKAPNPTGLIDTGRVSKRD